jgi:hypothetical protein
MHIISAMMQCILSHTLLHAEILGFMPKAVLPHRLPACLFTPRGAPLPLPPPKQRVWLPLLGCSQPSPLPTLPSPQPPLPATGSPASTLPLSPSGGLDAFVTGPLAVHTNSRVDAVIIQPSAQRTAPQRVGEISAAEAPESQTAAAVRQTGAAAVAGGATDTMDVEGSGLAPTQAPLLCQLHVRHLYGWVMQVRYVHCITAVLVRGSNADG